MLINLRNALMTGKRLPYDAELEYIESTGTQLIDTGVSGAEHNLIITAGVRINTFGAYAGAFGNYASESANCFRLILAGSNNGRAYANCGYITSGSHIITNFALGNWHTVILNGAEDRCFCDGVEYTKRDRYTQGTANVNTIRIFTSGGPAAGTWSKQVSAFKIELNGNLLRDFIPVRKGTVGYLYDRVSGKLFGNAGTGDFVLGPDVVPVEYIESHGTEYIKPNISVATNDSFALYVTGAFTGASSAMQLHGVNGGAYFGVQTNDNITVGGLDTNVPRDSAKHRWEMSATIGNSKTVSLNLDGTTYSRTRNNAEGHISLFALVFQSGGSPTYFCKFKMDAATIYKNGDLARKLHPVRVGTEGAMMDVLTRRIYRNAGTGAFGYGNDLKYPIPAE